MSNLELWDGDSATSFCFEDLLRYHGPGSPGGVAHAFKVLERALPLLSDGDQPPPRRDIQITTAFPGPGARDAFEMATRCVSENRYHVDLEHPDAAPAPVSARGYYFFRLCCGRLQVDCRLKPGLVREEFLTLSRMAQRTPEEEQRLTTLKWEMTERLLSLPAAEVYDAVQAGHDAAGTQ